MILEQKWEQNHFLKFNDNEMFVIISLPQGTTLHVSSNINLPWEKDLNARISSDKGTVSTFSIITTRQWT